MFPAAHVKSSIFILKCRSSKLDNESCDKRTEGVDGNISEGSVSAGGGPSRSAGPVLSWFLFCGYYNGPDLRQNCVCVCVCVL